MRLRYWVQGDEQSESREVGKMMIDHTLIIVSSIVSHEITVEGQLRVEGRRRKVANTHSRMPPDILPLARALANRPYVTLVYSSIRLFPARLFAGWLGGTGDGRERTRQWHTVTEDEQSSASPLCTRQEVGLG